MHLQSFNSLLLLGPVLLYSFSSAQTTTSPTACSASLTAQYSAPIVAAGWEARLVATGLTDPRGIIQDSAGNLLVVQQGQGIVALQMSDGGGTCLGVSKKINLINFSALNHGITMSTDGRTLYASSSDAVYAWPYDAAGPTVGQNTTLVTGMSNSDHTTRTLLVSAHSPGMLLVSRGSNSNVDPDALSISTGHSQIKVFNITAHSSGSPPLDYTTSGTLLGWGLRNSVGVAEEPITGGIYSVENSVDEISRLGTDIHEDNPGEEMNFHGYLNGTSSFTFSTSPGASSNTTHLQGSNYGYPSCFAIWDPSIPDQGSLTTGAQFVTSPNSTLNDTTCATNFIPPRLTFQAHMAPLDIIFNPSGTEAYITFHGSWDRTDPVGYKLSLVTFNNGEPTAPPNSTTSLQDIFSNSDNSQCPNGCFRPVGLVQDTKGRLFMTSDSTGEIYVIMRATASGRSSTTGGSGGSSTPGTGTGTGTAASASASQKGDAAGGKRDGALYWNVVVVGLASFVFCLLLY